MIGRSRMWAAASAVAAVLACGERAPEASPEPGEVVLRIVNGAPGPGGDSLVVIRGIDTMVVRVAELVLREIIVKPETLAVGPMRFALPLGADTVVIPPAVATAGPHRTLRFEIYPPTPERDSAFVVSHPDLTGVSLRVSGTYSRAGRRRAFVLTSDFNEVEEFTLAPVLVVAKQGTPPVLLGVDVAKWFLNADSTALIDPATAGPDGANAAQVRDNIRMSFAVRVGSSP